MCSRLYTQSGIALVSVLLMVTIILIVMSSLFYRHQLDITRASHSLISEQATLLALSAENWVQQILLEDKRASNTDNLLETWALPIPVMNIEGGQLSGCVVDQQAKLNINNLATYTTRERISEELEGRQSGTVSLLQRMFRDLAYTNPNEKVAILADWIDYDGTQNAYGGVEDGQYLLETPPRLAGNQTLSNIDELSSIRGFSILDMPILKSKFTALPQATRINVNTASADVLVSLVDGLDDYLVGEIIEARPFNEVDEFYQKLANLLYPTSEEQIKSSLPESVVSVESDFFQLKSMVEMGGISLLIQSSLYRASAQEIKVLQRQLIPIPKLSDIDGKRLPGMSICLASDHSQFIS